MDPRDFDFTLRSGIGAPGNTEGPVDWNNALTMMAISSVFLEKATQDAAEYVRHANRPVYGRDIVMALKYNALPPNRVLVNGKSADQGGRVARETAGDDGRGQFRRRRERGTRSGRRGRRGMGAGGGRFPHCVRHERGRRPVCAVAAFF